MDYRNILSTGFLLLCGAVFIHSLNTANAFPQGPNVSMGSNPIENFISSGSSNLSYTNNTNNNFIVTTAIIPNYQCALSLDGGTLPQKIYLSESYNLGSSPFTTGQAKLKVPPNSTLTINCTGVSYYIEGYYAH